MSRSFWAICFIYDDDVILGNVLFHVSAQQDMLAELKSLPMSRDTLRVQNRRDALERKLTEVDTALKIFSRPRVFIKDD